MDTTFSEEALELKDGDAASVATVTALLSIAKSTRAYVALLLADIDLHPGQDQLLDSLVMDEPVSVSVLAAQLSVRPSTVSKMLDRLIEKRLVERLANKTDMRRTMVKLTPEGEAMKAKVRDIWIRLEADLLNSLDDTQRRELACSLSQIDGLLAQRLRRLR